MVVPTGLEKHIAYILEGVVGLLPLIVTGPGLANRVAEAGDAYGGSLLAIIMGFMIYLFQLYQGAGFSWYRMGGPASIAALS